MKILLLTSIYPIPNVNITGSTSVCHYFAKDWVKEGHSVRVINTYTVYPRPLHRLSERFGKTIHNIFPVSINSRYFSNPLEYSIEGVDVLLAPTYKIFPHAPFSKKSILRTVNNIKAYLSIANFIPDVIIGHFLHPSIEIIPELKQLYPNVKTAIALHGKLEADKDISQIAKSKIDWWGFRSIPIGRSFQKLFPNFKHQFFCFSGVPEEYIIENSYLKHGNDAVCKFLFVGNLIRRKHPVELFDALQFAGINFKLKYIGDGNEKKKLEKLSEEIPTKVELLGRMPREEVAKAYNDAECFVMISRDETFGLVYLEAMAKGCITVASKDEGMDGIIKDGVNGFLCPAGDVNTLTGIIKHIAQMSKEEKQTMAKNAIETAKKMTDKKVAHNYLSNLYRIKNSE